MATTPKLACLQLIATEAECRANDTRPTPTPIILKDMVVPVPTLRNADRAAHACIEAKARGERGIVSVRVAIETSPMPHGYAWDMARHFLKKGEFDLAIDAIITGRAWNRSIQPFDAVFVGKALASGRYSHKLLCFLYFYLRECPVNIPLPIWRTIVSLKVARGIPIQQSQKDLAHETLEGSLIRAFVVMWEGYTKRMSATDKALCYDFEVAFNARWNEWRKRHPKPLVESATPSVSP